MLAKSFVVVAMSMAVILSAPLLVAQQPQEPDVNENLQQLRPHIGAWVCEDKTADGRPMVVRRKTQWAFDGNYMTAVTTISVSGKIELVHRHMVGWDSRQKMIRSWVFSSNGNFVRGVWKTTGETTAGGKVRGLNQDAEVLTANITYSFPEEDTMIYKATERTEGTESLADIEWKFKRVDQ